MGCASYRSLNQYNPTKVGPRSLLNGEMYIFADARNQTESYLYSWSIQSGFLHASNTVSPRPRKNIHSLGLTLTGSHVYTSPTSGTILVHKWICMNWLSQIISIILSRTYMWRLLSNILCTLVMYLETQLLLTHENLNR